MQAAFLPITSKGERMGDAPRSEEERVGRLRGLGLLDSKPEPEFDAIVELAAAICGTPICLISLVDKERQWFKAAHGLQVRETPLDVSFCAQAIKQDDLFVVEDATLDERFADTGLVTGEPRIRFYAGMPLTTDDGYALGTLCVIDVKPRKLTTEQQTALRVMSQQVQARIVMRAQRVALEGSLRQQKELAASLRKSEALFRSFMSNTPHVNYIKDADGRMMFYNREFASQLGVTMDECLGKLDHELWPEENARQFRKHDLEVLAGGVRVDYDEQLRHKNGKLLYFRSTKFPYEDGTGKTLLAGVSVDITEEVERKAELVRSRAELEAANRRLQQMSMTDALTGLRNRRAFDERLAVEFALSRRVGRDASVMLIDIDDFKQINDRLGHAAGDEVLRDLSRALETTVRLTDMAARYGGEEFAVLLPDSSVAQAARCAERFRECLKNRGADARLSYGPITVSIGIAGIAYAENEAALLGYADVALYEAKRRGKNTVVTYRREIQGMSRTKAAYVSLES